MVHVEKAAMHVDAYPNSSKKFSRPELSKYLFMFSDFNQVLA